MVWLREVESGEFPRDPSNLIWADGDWLVPGGAEFTDDPRPFILCSIFRASGHGGVTMNQCTWQMRLF